ncbi:Fe2+-dependent dioxygenase [Litoricolaceae bacterium]|nr:Fe2+-dependent dioxygenase [Litorivicinaceae bacterium]
MHLISLLDAEQLKFIHRELKKIEWEDGRDTAQAGAKDIKSNLQITPGNSRGIPLLKGVVKVLKENNTVNILAMPRKVIAPRFAKYTGGGAYGWHVDAPFMEQVRTDLSLTIFLSDPDSYEGGELQLDYGTTAGLVRVKGQAGQMLLYPTGVLHQVTPVTSGERLVFVGWINSFIQNHATRDSLSSLNNSALRLANMIGKDEINKDDALKLLGRIHESSMNLTRDLIS